MSGVEILPALIYGGMAAGEGTAAGAGAAAAAAGAGALGAGALGAGALGGAGGSGLTAAEMAALEASAAQGLAAGGEGFGVSSLGGAQGSLGLLGDLGGVEVATTPADYGPEFDSTAKFDQFESLKTKSLNALNKVGGALNKLPKPVQGMLMSSLLAPPKQQTPPPAQMPPRQAQQAPSMTPTYQTSAPPPQYFAGSGGASGVGDGMGGGYGGSAQMQGAGLLGQNITPQELEMLRRLRMQRRM